MPNIYRAEELRSIAHEVERRERALQRLAFCFDVYTEYTRDGREPTEHMDAAKATRQLENAICAVLGLPEGDK
jgi:hypothetical protein